MKDKEIEILAKSLTSKINNRNCELDNEFKISISKAITILQSQGYVITPPYTPPTDHEIIARIKSENEKVGYVAEKDRYVVGYDCDNSIYYSCDCSFRYITLGTTYTTQSIAQQIVDELNSKRFVRV